MSFLSNKTLIDARRECYNSPEKRHLLMDELAGDLGLFSTIPLTADGLRIDPMKVAAHNLAVKKLSDLGLTQDNMLDALIDAWWALDYKGEK